MGLERLIPGMQEQDATELASQVVRENETPATVGVVGILRLHLLETPGVEATTGPPVDPVGPGEQPFIHEIAPQRRVVLMEHLKREVDLGFLVAQSRLELLCQAFEDDHALRPV